MSSTGRGNERLGGKLDVYPTPAWCVERLLEKWAPRAGMLVEPCVGSGVIVRVCQSDWSYIQTRSWLTYDIRNVVPDVPKPDWVDHKQANFLKVKTPVDAVSAVITNPPYLYAEQFIRRCRKLYRFADIVMLLRLGFLGSEARKPFHEEFGVPDVLQFPNRPSFLRKGTDSTEYAWMIYPPEPQFVGRYMRLEYTPLEERKPKVKRVKAVRTLILKAP